jgi:repressor LexA
MVPLGEAMPAGGSRTEFLRGQWDGRKVMLDPLQDRAHSRPSHGPIASCAAKRARRCSQKRVKCRSICSIVADLLDGFGLVAYSFRIRSPKETCGCLRASSTNCSRSFRRGLMRPASPSFEEMKEALDLKSKSGVHRLISALEERGFIRRLPNRARALEVIREPESLATKAPSRTRATSAAPASTPPLRKPANDVVEIPLHGRIAAGMPIEAIEGSAMLPVPAALLGSGEHYALEVSGDSMVDAGILDGDVALVRRTNVARDGEIVVALIHGEEATLKYLRHERGRIRLDPANAAYEPQFYAESEIEVQGKLAGLLRRYH